MNNMKHFILAASLAAMAAPIAQAEQKPNILFIAIDDMNDWTGFLGGHPQAITPNMDKLAKKGVNFTNAHCPAPGCSPSRNALLFGIEPFHSGLYAFYDEGTPEKVAKTHVSIPLFLRQNGYETFGSGKVFHGQFHTPEDWNDYRDPIKKKLNFDLTEGYQQENNLEKRFGPLTTPVEDHPDYQFTSYGVEILKKKHDQPFFLAIGLTKPHIPCICPKEFFDLYPKDIEPPPINPNDLDDIPAVGVALALANSDKKIKADNAWNTIRRSYLACISWTDHNVGLLLDTLAASPYADNCCRAVNF